MFLLTTTRYVYSHLNYNLNTNFINSLFEKIDKNPTLGDMFLKTKVLWYKYYSNKFIYRSYMSLAPERCKNNYVSRYSFSLKITFTGEVINEDLPKSK